MKQSGQDKGTLLLALIAGLSINGTFAAIFSSIVPFSIFPLIALVLTVYCLHQRYLNRTMPVGLPGLAAACFILGVLLYSTVVRAEYPDIGSNFFPAVLSVALVFWIGSRMRSRKSQLQSKNYCRPDKRHPAGGASLTCPTDHLR
jgi:hypothetical protein